MTPARAAGVLTEAALVLAAFERRITLSFSVDAEVLDAIALLPDATVRETVYVSDIEEPYVIRVAEVRIGKVELHAQTSRPATATEMEAAGDWAELPRVPTRAGHLRRTS